jgi:hypothetical protein
MSAEIGWRKFQKEEKMMGRTSPQLQTLVQRELHCDVADAHETRGETFVKRSETLCPVDRLHSIEGVFVTFLSGRDGLSLSSDMIRQCISTSSPRMLTREWVEG